MQEHVTMEQVDFHTHSAYSGEPQAEGFTIERMFEVADRLGLRRVGFTEHWKPDTDPALFDKIRAEVDALQPAHRTQFHVSAEIGVLDCEGALACDLALAKEKLDYVSVGPHVMSDNPTDALRMIRSLCEKPDIDVILHPHMLGAHQLYDDAAGARRFFREIVHMIRDAGKVVECPSIAMITRYFTKQQWPAINIDTYPIFLEEAAHCGVAFTVGSDAHNETKDWGGEVVPWFGHNEETIRLLRDAGIDESKLWLA